MEVKRIADHFLKDPSHYRTIHFDPEIVALLQKKKIESDAKLQLFTTLIQSDKSPNTIKSYMSVFEEL
jgi:hypothetical protein